MISLDRKGIIKSNGYVEGLEEDSDYMNSECKSYIIEPDGARFGNIFYHKNPASYLFTSTDNFAGVIDKTNLYFAVNPILGWKTNTNRYEFLVRQKLTSSGEWKKYRWIQMVNPMTASWFDVDESRIIKIIGNGYSSFNNHGGLYHNGNCTYLSDNNHTEGNWWGAVGAWTNHNGGLPAWNNEVVTTGEMWLYVRVDNDKKYFCTSETNGIIANELYEI